MNEICRRIAICLAFALPGLLQNAVHAVSVARYDADAEATAPDPTSAAGGGWGTIINAGGVPVGPVSDGGLNAWNINDNGPGSYRYKSMLTVADTTALAASGWTLHGRWRFVNGDSTIPSQMLQYADGVNRYIALFDIDAAGQTISVRQLGDATAADGSTTISHLVTTPILTGSQALTYHDYRITFDPTDGRVQLFLDSTLIFSDWGGQPETDRLVQWGAGNGGGQGNANWRLLDLSPPMAQSPTPGHGPTGAIPEPTTAAPALLAAACLGRPRRRTHP